MEQNSETYSAIVHFPHEATVGAETADETKMQDMLERRNISSTKSARPPQKSLSSSLGLGSGMIGNLTVSALFTLLLLYILIPVTLLRQQQRRIGGGSGLETLQPGESALPKHDVVPQPEEDNKVPVTRDLLASFQEVKDPQTSSILLLIATEDWKLLKDKFSSRENKANEVVASLEARKAIKMGPVVLAMDLICLENEVAKAQIDIERMDTEKADISVVAKLYQRKMEARRRQRKAAELWEQAVKHDLLGRDEAVKNSLLRLLTAVQSRAAASEQFISLMLSIKQQSDPNDKLSSWLKTEARHAGEAVASLSAAGQLAAFDPTLKSAIGEWVPLIFALI